ncbi:signal peptidase I [Eubacterium oxidoreducens]|uniref:Signal peptidase I n=1 Tax=Eubacterium oxidoreducens TaxID=1732 RepID=A0A1G6BC05_EUBOX|nr:signal peptidase I [Eubacterium oxidoreducens]SDB18171.1 signal peptidase I [Eubacterium oxidoreducens]
MEENKNIMPQENTEETTQEQTIAQSDTISESEYNEAQQVRATLSDGVSKEAEKDNVDIKKEVISWIRLIAIVIVVVVVVKQFVIVNAIVPTGSMENTIMPDDRLIGFRLAYKISEPQRYDIAIFKYPVDESQVYIKRIIGLPGEKVTIEDGKIYINDSKEPLDEPYLKEEWTVECTGYTFEVPEDCYLMLGDNRNISADARYWADEALMSEIAQTEDEAAAYQYVSKDKILGKAIVRYWPSIEMLTADELQQAE